MHLGSFGIVLSRQASKILLGLFTFTIAHCIAITNQLSSVIFFSLFCQLTFLKKDTAIYILPMGPLVLLLLKRPLLSFASFALSWVLFVFCRRRPRLACGTRRAPSGACVLRKVYCLLALHVVVPDVVRSLAGVEPTRDQFRCFMSMERRISWL